MCRRALIAGLLTALLAVASAQASQKCESSRNFYLFSTISKEQLLSPALRAKFVGPNESNRVLDVGYILDRHPMNGVEWKSNTPDYMNYDLFGIDGRSVLARELILDGQAVSDTEKSVRAILDPLFTGQALPKRWGSTYRGRQLVRSEYEPYTGVVLNCELYNRLVVGENRYKQLPRGVFAYVIHAGEIYDRETFSQKTADAAMAEKFFDPEPYLASARQQFGRGIDQMLRGVVCEDGRIVEWIRRSLINFEIVRSEVWKENRKKPVPLLVSEPWQGNGFYDHKTAYDEVSPVIDMVMRSVSACYKEEAKAKVPQLTNILIRCGVCAVEEIHDENILKIAALYSVKSEQLLSRAKATISTHYWHYWINGGLVTEPARRSVARHGIETMGTDFSVVGDGSPRPIDIEQALNRELRGACNNAATMAALSRNTLLGPLLSTEVRGGAGGCSAASAGVVSSSRFGKVKIQSCAKSGSEYHCSFSASLLFESNPGMPAFIERLVRETPSRTVRWRFWKAGDGWRGTEL